MLALTFQTDVVSHPAPEKVVLSFICVVVLPTTPTPPALVALPEVSVFQKLLMTVPAPLKDPMNPCPFVALTRPVA